MKSTNKIIVFFSICLIIIFWSVSASIRIPEGYRYIKKSEIKNSDWREEDERNFLHIEADFNGDRLLDKASLLRRIDGNGLALFVFLSKRSSGYHIFKLFESNDKESIDYIGISLVKPGTYLTARGKGYGKETANGETVEIRNFSINMFFHEVSSCFYIWDEKKQNFRSVWMSD